MSALFGILFAAGIALLLVPENKNGNWIRLVVTLAALCAAIGCLGKIFPASAPDFRDEEREVSFERNLTERSVRVSVQLRAEELFFEHEKRMPDRIEVSLREQDGTFEIDRITVYGEVHSAEALEYLAQKLGTGAVYYGKDKGD